MIAPEFDLRRLYRRDPRVTSLCLSFSCTAHVGACRIADLQESLQRNTSLNSVMIFLDSSFAPTRRTPSPFDRSSTQQSYYNSASLLTCEKNDGVLRDMGRLPNLKHLQYSSAPGEQQGALPVRALLPVLQEAITSGGQLQSLILSDLELAGTALEFEQLAQILQGMWYLTKFSMEGVQLTTLSGEESSLSKHTSGLSGETPTATSAPLDTLLLSLSMLPSLHSLTLTGQKKNITRDRRKQNTVPEETSALTICDTAVSALVLSSSIKILTFKNLDFTSENIVSLSSTLRFNKSLEVLTMGPLPAVDTNAATALASALKHSTSLIKLELELSSIPSTAISQILASALHGGNPQKGQGLQSLVLSGHRLGRVSKAVTTVFTDMLKSNYTLRHCMLFRKTFLKSTILHYIRLNAMGRQTLLQADHSVPIWMQVLSHPVVNNDLDAIYYFLSSQPTVCVQAAAAAKEDEEAATCRKLESITDRLLGMITRPNKRQKV